MDPEGYAGSDRCAECHPKHYEGWSQTFHATVVQDVRKHPEAVLGDFTQKGIGFTLEEVEYTIGGHKDQRYMKRIGDEYYILPKSWSVRSQVWRDTGTGLFWRRRPYSTSCKGCHVTGYDPKGNVPFAEHRVGCEACHGPGWDHARSSGAKPILHPGELPDDRRAMICAACHVRGKDRGGEYEFPVGFLPGEDLGTYYVPHKKKDGETNSQAILRLFEKWMYDWKEFGGQSCEICKVPGLDEKQVETGAKGPMDDCFRCHEFKERYQEHTHHPEGTAILCSDCHKQQPKSFDQPTEFDIHTPQYFLQHVDDCYDNRFEPACLACHADRDPVWARQMVDRWGKPVEIDH